MTKLKTNFAIRTTDENFRAHVETLKVLGYDIYPCTDKGNNMDGWSYLRSEARYSDLCRGKYNASLNNFSNIQDFLVWHFTPEAPKKTEAEIRLDTVLGRIAELRHQEHMLCEQILKETKENK